MNDREKKLDAARRKLADTAWLGSAHPERKAAQKEFDSLTDSRLRALAELEDHRNALDRAELDGDLRVAQRARDERKGTP